MTGASTRTLMASLANCSAAAEEAAMAAARLGESFEPCRIGARPAVFSPRGPLGSPAPGPVPGLVELNEELDGCFLIPTRAPAAAAPRNDCVLRASPSASAAPAPLPAAAPPRSERRDPGAGGGGPPSDGGCAACLEALPGIVSPPFRDPPARGGVGVGAAPCVWEPPVVAAGGSRGGVPGA